MQLSVLKGSQLAAISNEGDLFINDGGRWQAIDTSGADGSRRIVATLPDGRTLVTSRNDPPRAELWSVDRPHVTRQISIKGQTVCGAAAPDGRWLALGRADGAIELRELAATGPGARLLGHHGAIHALAFAADSRTLASAGADGTARLWNVDTAAELFVIARGLGPLRTVAFSPDGASLAIGGEQHGNAATLTIFRTGQ
jgi:WD40 repeat protein